MLIQVNYSIAPKNKPELLRATLVVSIYPKFETGNNSPISPLHCPGNRLMHTSQKREIMGHICPYIIAKFGKIQILDREILAL